MDLGYDFKLDLGAVGVGVSLPFANVFDDFYRDYSVFSLSYSLWDLELMGGVSKYNNVLALKFASISNSIGIYYGKLDNLGDFSEVEEEYAGISLEIFI